MLLKYKNIDEIKLRCTTSSLGSFVLCTHVGLMRLVECKERRNPRRKKKEKSVLMSDIFERFSFLSLCSLPCLQIYHTLHFVTTNNFPRLPLRSWTLELDP
jgi:hypothetical protein